MDFSSILTNVGRNVATGAGGGNPLDKVLGILGSKGGQTAVGALGAGLNAYGQNQQASANREQSAQQFGVNTMQRQLEADQQDARQRQMGALDANPLGSEQEFAQRNAILQQLLSGARDFKVTPGDPRVASAMGQMSGGISLGAGGLNANGAIDRTFGNDATLASLQSRGQALGQLNPGGPVTNLGSMFGQQGTDTTNSIMAANQQQQKIDEAKSAQQREMIRRAIENDIRGAAAPKQNKAKSALGGAASGAMTGASLGSIVPGIGTGIGAAIGGVGGFLKGLF